MKRCRSLLPCILAALAAGGAARADSMSCGVKLVLTGDYKYDVEEACGDPDHKEQHFIVGPFQYRDRHGRPYWVEGIRVDTWVYRYGPQRFDRVLRFENDRLVKIEMTRR